MALALALCPMITEIINTPINWKAEKETVGVIAGIALILLFFGANCYKYSGVINKANNQRFAKVLFLAAGLILTITSLVFCIRLYKHS